MGITMNLKKNIKKGLTPDTSPKERGEATPQPS
jgi:hypothetical protein